MKPKNTTQTAKHLITLCVSDWPEAHANVEFICKAVNEHDTLIAQRDALLEAVKSCLEWMEFTIPLCKGHTEVMNWGGPISRARNSIALCEPKEKEMV